MKKYIYGIYEDEEKLLNVGHLLKNQNIAIVDFFTPFPVHGLDQIQGIERTRLPFVTFIAGGIGLALAPGTDGTRDEPPSPVWPGRGG